AVWIYRLDQVLGGAEQQAEVAIVDDRHHDYRDGRRRRITFQRVQHAPAIEFGQADIECDRKRQQLASALDGRVAVGGDLHSIAVRFEIRPQDAGDVHVVLDD